MRARKLSTTIVDCAGNGMLDAANEDSGENCEDGEEKEEQQQKEVGEQQDIMRDALVESKKQYWQEQEHEYCCQLH